MAGVLDKVWKKSSTSASNDKPEELNSEVFNRILDGKDFFEKEGI